MDPYLLFALCFVPILAILVVCFLFDNYSGNSLVLDTSICDDDLNTNDVELFSGVMSRLGFDDPPTQAADRRPPEIHVRVARDEEDEDCSDWLVFRHGGVYRTEFAASLAPMRHFSQLDKEDEPSDERFLSDDVLRDRKMKKVKIGGTLFEYAEFRHACNIAFVFDLSGSSNDKLRLLLQMLNQAEFAFLTTNLCTEGLYSITELLPKSVRKLEYCPREPINESDFLATLKKAPQIRALHLEFVGKLSASFFSHSVITNLRHFGFIGFKSEASSAFDAHDLLMTKWTRAYVIPTAIKKDGVRAFLREWAAGRRAITRLVLMVNESMKLMDIVEELKPVTKSQPKKDFPEGIQLTREDGESICVFLARVNEDSKIAILGITTEQLDCFDRPYRDAAMFRDLLKMSN